MTSLSEQAHAQQTPPRADVPAQPSRADANGTATEETVTTATGEKWAICCSGGGIRSAAYCLGALQSLQERGLLAKAKWILGVSGGSYIAASRALVAHDLAATAPGPDDPAPAGPPQPAYAPGTPEELNLRLNTRYIAPDGSTVLVGALSLLLGVVVTFILALAPVYALAHAWGWLLRWRGAVVPSGDNAVNAHVTEVSWWLWPAILTGLTLVLFVAWWKSLHPRVTRKPGRWPSWLTRFRRAPRDPGHRPWWVYLKPDDRDSGANRAVVVARAAVLAAGLAVAMLAVPALLSWLTRISGPVGDLARAIGFGARPSWSLPALAGLVTAIGAVAKYVQGGLAKWNAAPAGASSGSAQAASSGLLAQAGGWLRQKLTPWLASAVVVLGGLVLALLWTSDGARAGYTNSQLWWVLGALAVMVITRAGVNVNRLSLHDVYRWRLADAFAVTRAAALATDPIKARDLFSKASATRLSELRDPDGEPDEPGLVICGTVNINAAREVPRGQDGFCIAFDPGNVTLHRECGQKTGSVTARTADYEALMGKPHCTLFDVSAISGAAVSPLMGSATRQAYRILFTFTNIRLGVWLPHPALVRDARGLLDSLNRTDAAGTRRVPLRKQRPLPDDDKGADWDNDRRWAYRPLLLLLWYLAPHPLWDRRPNRNHWREVRLWAHVLDLRVNDRWTGGLWLRVLQPTLGLLWAEAFGDLSFRSTWMYVTDGGHYDNLGLVEALHRGANRIVVLDASGDQVSTWSTLGSAIALARSDTGTRVTLNPSVMWTSGLAAGEVSRPWVSGTFERPGDPAEGRIWVCKLGWWSGAPWDVLAYAKGHPSFPCDGTLQQLYDVTEFEAYHQLGAASAAGAAEDCDPPLKLAAGVTQEAVR